MAPMGDLYESLCNMSEADRAALRDELYAAFPAPQGRLPPRRTKDLVLEDMAATGDFKTARKVNGLVVADVEDHLKGKWKTVAGEEYETLLKRHQNGSALTAQFIRQYIWEILMLCPTDYFVLAADGTFCIDPQEWRDLPMNIKRLVESVEVRRVAGQFVLSVRFLSKTAALALATRLVDATLSQESRAQLPWDEIAKAIPRKLEDKIAKRLSEEEISAREQTSM